MRRTHLFKHSTRLFRSIKKIYWLFLLLWPGTTAVFAQPLANVALVSFNATPHENGVYLSWVTATELDTIGFRLAHVINGTETPLQTIGPNSDGFIPASGSPTLGATYDVLDAQDNADQTVTYHLLEQMLDGQTRLLSSVTITLTEPATSIPMVQPPTVPPPTAVPPTALPPTPTAVSPTINATVETASPQPSALPTQTALPMTQTPLPTETAVQIAAVQPTQLDEAPPLQSEPALPVILQTDPTAYPAPPTPLPPEAPTAYPERTPVPTPLPAVSPSPYPVGTLNGDSRMTPTAVPVIGADAIESFTLQNEPADQPEQLTPGTGRIYLWGGFFIGMLIFITAVFGAIMLFTRRNGS